MVLCCNRYNVGAFALSQYDQPNDDKIHFSMHSWHFRLVKYSKGVHYTSLCPYMRAVVMSFFMLPFKYAWNALPDFINDHEDWGRVVIGYAMCVAFISMLGSWASESPFYAWMLVGLGGGYLLMIIVYGIYKACCAVGDWNDDRPRHYTEHKTRGLMKEYVQAKHNKVCPSICFAEPQHFDKNGQKDNDTDCR